MEIKGLLMISQDQMLRKQTQNKANSKPIKPNLLEIKNPANSRFFLKSPPFFNSGFFSSLYFPPAPRQYLAMPAVQSSEYIEESKHSASNGSPNTFSVCPLPINFEPKVAFA
jgi:hypothetical protein